MKKYALLLILACDLIAEDLTLNVTGVGESKADAILDAQRNALRVSYGEFVSSNLTTLNNQLTKNETVNLVSGTVKDFKVLSESVNDFSIPPIVEVLLRVKVGKGQLISFARAIGDNVEVQGSLFGAEIRQQEQNKKNESVALEHLEKKAKLMSTFFDYEIKVGDPKQSTVNGNDYVIGSIVTLKPNKNYQNLISTLESTLKEISMKKEERDKYINLNTSIHGLKYITVNNPRCLKLGAVKGYQYNVGNLRDVSSSSTKPFHVSWSYTGSNPRETVQKEIDYIKRVTDLTLFKSDLSQSDDRFGRNFTCGIGKIDTIYFRTSKVNQTLQNINKHIHQSVFNYELYRRTNSSKTLMIPSELRRPSWTKERSINIGSKEGDFGYLGLKNLIIRNMGQNDKDKVLENTGWTIRLSDKNFSDYVNYVGSKFRSKFIGYFQPEGWVSSSKFYRAGGEIKKEKAPVALKRELCLEKDIGTPYSVKGDKLPSCHYASITQSLFVPECEQGYYSEGLVKCVGVMQSFSKNVTFAELFFMDIVDKDLLSKITEYSIDPDKPTKY
jgi:hypothetical protein